MNRKKGLLLVIICIGFMSIHTWTEARTDGLLWRQLSSENPLKKNKYILSNQPLQGLFLFPETAFDTVEAAQIIKTIHQLPKSLLIKIVNHDIRIHLFQGKLTENQGVEHLKGVLPRGYRNSATTWDDVPGMGGSRKVYVKIGASDKGEGHGSVNLELHELAHSIDKIVFDGIRYDIDFLKIWASESKQVFPNQSYFIEYPEEYFAETFAMFYVNTEENLRLKKLAPQTYEFIKKMQ